MYSLGTSVLSEELRSSGFSVLCSQEEHSEKYFDFDYHNDDRVLLDKSIEAVVMGYDTHVNLFKLTFAGYCVQNGAKLIATNMDMQSQNVDL